MKELHVEGVATRNDPESCGQHRKVLVEALTGASMGAAIEPRKYIPEADPVSVAGRQHGPSRHREARSVPAGSENRRTSRTFEHENREIPGTPGGVVRPGRAVKGPTQTTAMHVSGKSDKDVVPMNHRRSSDRGMGEGRSETAGNPDWPTMAETPNSGTMMSGLERIRQAARGNKK
jgi:hypothetical protein